MICKADEDSTQKYQYNTPWLYCEGISYLKSLAFLQIAQLQNINGGQNKLEQIDTTQEFFSSLTGHELMENSNYRVVNEILISFLSVPQISSSPQTMDGAFDKITTIYSAYVGLSKL